MEIHPIPNHATLPDMPSATNTDHDGRYYTETEIDTMLGDGTVDHGNLSGLVGDDHTHYLLADGTRALTGDLDLTGDRSITASITLSLIGGDSVDIRAADPIEFRPSGDIDDYIAIATDNHIPRIYTIGNCDLKIEPSGDNINLLGTNLQNVGTLGVGTVTATQLTSTGDITMEGHLLTMGNIEAATDMVLRFLGSTHSTDVTYDESAAAFNFDIATITAGFLDNTTITNCAIATTCTQTEWDAANTHIGESGASHTYIDQTVISGSAPTFTANNFSDGGSNAIVTTTQETNWDNHIADNSQAHSDYLINNGDDSTSGWLTSESGFKAADGTNAAPSYTFGSDLDTGMFLGAASNIGFAFGGVESLTLTQNAFNYYVYHNTGPIGPVFNFNRAKGTEASPTVVTSDNLIMRILARAYDGNGWNETAQIAVEATENHVQDTSSPVRMEFHTTPSGSQVKVERMRIDDDGTIYMGDITTNHLAVSNTGVVTLAGSAKVTNALWIGATGIRAPPLTKPADEVEHGISVAWEFSDATDDTVMANMRIPNRMDRTVAPTFTLGWSSTTQSKFCEWQVEYLWTKADGDTKAGADDTLLSSTDAAGSSTSSGTAEGLVLTTFTLAVPDANDACLHLRIKRRADLGGDTIDGDTVELHGICLNFTSDKLGT